MVKSEPVTQTPALKILICAGISMSVLLALDFVIQWLQDRNGFSGWHIGGLSFDPPVLFHWQCCIYLLPLLAGMSLHWSRLRSISINSLVFASIVTIPVLSFFVMYLFSFFGAGNPWIHPALAFLAGLSFPAFLHKNG